MNDFGRFVCRLNQIFYNIETDIGKAKEMLWSKQKADSSQLKLNLAFSFHEHKKRLKK